MKRSLKLGLKCTSIYLAINLNLILVLYILPIWVPSSRYALTEPLWRLYDFVNFWDAILCFWGDSFLNLTFTDTIQRISFWLAAGCNLKWTQLLLLYEAFFTSLYGGLFYFALGSLASIVLSGISQWRSSIKLTRSAENPASWWRLW